MDLQNNTILRYGFLELLKKEFQIDIREDELEKIELAKKCIKIYDTPEDFLNHSGWRNDNPECSDFQYLQENRICRKINGKIWYFSRIQYGEGEKERYKRCD